MSSNTLRGIGQEGDGKGEGEDSQDQPDADGRKLLDRLQQLRNIRSLDSTVPGTRSLDSSVPDAAPSLDAKVPSLAATLMGVPAPVIHSREQGTVQGRDVHLPAEVRRMAGVRPIAGVYDATANSVEHSGPSLADPVPTVVIAESAGENIRGHGHADLNSHGPWYDQEPVGGDVYDDPRPNILGRLAIGVAVAAGLSVVLFAVGRSRNQDAATEQSQTRFEAPAILPAPPLAPAPAKLAAVPTPDPVLPSNSPSAPAVPPSQVNPAALPSVITRPTRTVAAVPRTPPEGMPAGTSRPRIAPVGQPAATITKPATSVGPRKATIATIATTATTATKATTATTATKAATPTANVAQPVPAAPPPLPERATAEADPPPAPKHAVPEKSRAKPAYDPDSTLPLNLD